MLLFIFLLNYRGNNFFSSILAKTMKFSHETLRWERSYLQLRLSTIIVFFQQKSFAREGRNFQNGHRLHLLGWRFYADASTNFVCFLVFIARHEIKWIKHTFPETDIQNKMLFIFQDVVFMNGYKDSALMRKQIAAFRLDKIRRTEEKDKLE